MKKSEQLLKFNTTIAFFETMIERAIKEDNQDYAMVWYYKLTGANNLAASLGIHPSSESYLDKENSWFERILNETTTILR